jgi:hypothetical protein
MAKGGVCEDGQALARVEDSAGLRHYGGDVVVELLSSVVVILVVSCGLT